MKNNEYILYLDMDGVLIDFEGGYKRITKGFDFDAVAKEHGEEEAKRLYLEWGVGFWSNLDWIHGGPELYQAAKTLFEKVCILSSSGTRDPEKGKMVKEGKLRWLTKNMPDMVTGNVFIVNGKENKQKFSNQLSILVDDVPLTIRQWNQKGGYGVLHHASHYKRTIEELEDISRPIKISELVKRFKR